MALKKCKECGEEISSGAKTCPKCGKDQRNFFQKHIILTIILVIIVLGIIGGSTSNNSTKTDSNQSSSTKATQAVEEPVEYQKVDIDTLEDALENNAAAAKDTYNGKYLEITGRLGTIDSDLKYISLLSTTDKWDILGVHCTIKDDIQKEFIKTLSKDDTIIVKGKITDVGEVLGYYLDITEISK